MVECITPFSSLLPLLDHHSSSRGRHQAGRGTGGFEGRKAGTVALRQWRVAGFDEDCVEGEGEEGREALGRCKGERGLGQRVGGGVSASPNSSSSPSSPIALCKIDQQLDKACIVSS